MKINKYKDYSIYSMPIWGMSSKKKVKNLIKKFTKIITVEDHFYDGGFGSWLKECIFNINIKTKIISKFIENSVINDVGSANYLASNMTKINREN